LVAVGHQSGGIWTNFSKVVPQPPIDPTRNGVVEYRTASGERRLGAVSVVAGTPWAAWIEFPRDRILAPAYAMQRRMVVFGLIAIGLSALLISVVSARITTPLHDLTTATAAIASGEYTRRVRTARRGDEIGQLADAFNAMTERVAADHDELESRVRERTATLDRFFSLSIDLLCIAGTDGRFQRVNPAWEETLGWSADELTSMPYMDLVHPDDRAATAHEAAGLAAGGITVRFENRYRAKDGSYRWLSWKSAAAGEQGLIYAAARDVTDEKRATEALARHVSELNVINDELEVSREARKDIRWDVRPLPHVQGDPSMLRLVFVNLLSNAVKYSSNRPHPVIEVNVDGAGSTETVVYVRDNGVGFDMAYADKLFGV